MDTISLTLFFTFLFLIIWIPLSPAWAARKYSKLSRKMSYFSVLGNLGDYFSSARFKTISINVYILQEVMGFHQLFKKENFCVIWWSFWPFLYVFKAKAVEEIISGTKNMEKSWIYDWIRPWLGSGLLTSSGSKWKSRRKLLTPAFHFDILKDFMPVFNEQSNLLVKILEKEEGKPWINIVQYIQRCSLDIICETTLGVSVGAQKDNKSEYVKAVSGAANNVMQRLVQPLFAFNWIFNISSCGFQFRKNVKALHNFTRKVIADKKRKLLSGNEEGCKKKRKALMDLLLEHHVQNQTITEEDIREEVDTFVFEGHDTTAMGMSFALYMIGLYKNVQENVQEELNRIFGDDCEREITTDDLKDMEYLDRVLKESQRLYPSVPIVARKLKEDITVCDTKFPKHFNVVVFVHCLHRDEDVFPNPERFDPDRFLPENVADRSPFAYIPFSAGPRNCIGKILVTGGFDGFQFHSSAEVYDPVEDQWTLVENLIHPRSGHSMVSFDGQVYALGGFNGYRRLREVERYCETTDTWENFVPLTMGRSNFSTAVFQQQIFVVGGYDGQRFAVMEEKVVIANILRNFSIESLDQRDKVLLSPEITIKPASPIRIRLKSRRRVASI